MSRLDRVINTIGKEIAQGIQNAGIHIPQILILNGGIPEASEEYPVVVYIGLIPLPDPSLPPGEKDTGIIAPFAAVHHYRIISRSLQSLVKRLCAGRAENSPQKRQKQDFRVFSNSRLPERSMAAAAGIGWVGKNGLLMNRRYGSSFILAGILVSGDTAAEIIRDTQGSPVVSSLTPPESIYEECRRCSICIESCPTGAILPAGGIDTRRCLQALATSPEPLPDFAAEQWGLRIYGCSICQQVCPVNRARSFKAQPLAKDREFYGLMKLLEKLTPTPDRSWASIRLKEIFPGTALEAGWVPKDAIIRNILTAAGNSGNRSYIPLLEKIRNQSLPPMIQETLERTIKFLQTRYGEE